MSKLRPSLPEIDLLALYQALRTHYGPLIGPDALQPWWPFQSANQPLEVLVGAVLVQQTRWETVEAAITRLLAADLLDVTALANADVATLAALIRPVAFHSQKSSGLIAIAQYLEARYGGELNALLTQPTEVARRELLALPRIGPETADVILLYAGTHPVFVIDEYTRRLGERLAPAAIWRQRYEDLRAHFEQALPNDAQLFADFHAQINEHSVRYCLARPRCDGPPARRIYSQQAGRESYLDRHEGCPLRQICQYYSTSAKT